MVLNGIYINNAIVHIPIHKFPSYLSTTKWIGTELVVEMPESVWKFDDSINNFDDFYKLLLCLNYWKIEKENYPLRLYDFLLHNSPLNLQPEFIAKIKLLISLDLLLLLNIQYNQMDLDIL